MTRPAIAELVLAAAPRPASRRHQAIVVTLLLHAFVAVAILRAQPTLETWSAEMAARVHDDLTRLQLAEIEALEPPPPPPPEVKAELPPPPTPTEAPAPAPEPTKPAARPSPAKAARVVTAPAGALDLTGDVIVTGRASAYAGGVTTPTGTSDKPVSSVSPTNPPNAPPNTQPPSQPPPRKDDRSRPVRPASDEWNCPWPAAAEGLPIDEQVATIRVVVAPDGAVESTELVADPGDGFGPAALACARRTRFSPALDVDGRPIRARSPAIRVHFDRERG